MCYVKDSVGSKERIMVSAANDFSLRIVLLAANQFRCQIVLSAANEFSLPNRVVSSESVFAVELCCLQRMSFRC
jgi:hypothetical protein